MAKLSNTKPRDSVNPQLTIARQPSNFPLMCLRKFAALTGSSWNGILMRSTTTTCRLIRPKARPFVKRFVYLLILMFFETALAQDFAPERVANMIYEKVPSSGIVTPPVSLLLSNNGIVYRFSAIEDSRPLVPLAHYTWRKTGANSGSLGLGEGATQSQTVVTFSSIRRGIYSDGLATGIITFTPCPLPSDAPLRNLSTRTILAPGQLSITGFVVAGAAPRRVLVRAIGPSLAQFGVVNVAANPALTVLKGDSQIGANSGWGGAATTAAVFSLVGAFDLSVTSRDSALVLTLDAGNYTAQVRADSGGEVLVEVYFVD